eukprot:scaffold19241_cov105-Isochrysis_galbana.AAC.2
MGAARWSRRGLRARAGTTTGAMLARNAPAAGVAGGAARRRGGVPRAGSALGAAPCARASGGASRRSAGNGAGGHRAIVIRR